MLRFIQITALIFCLLKSYSTSAQNTSIDTNFHIYLLIGQSNMAGRGGIDEHSKTINRQILMLDSLNSWQPATDPVHFDKPKAAEVGPAISFAQEMTGNNKSIRIGLVPCAWGGSPIKVWEPGASYLQTAHPYDDALLRVKTAMKYGVLKGILWHQGESDNDSLRAKAYLEKLKSLVKRFRVDLQQPNLPFVAGEIGHFNKANFINPVINQLSQQVPQTAVVSASGLEHKGDNLHFNTSSARELGRRYAQKMKMIQTSVKRNPIVVLCFDDAEISHYTIVAPLLKKNGFNATFMVCEFPLKSPGDSTYYMSWHQIAELNKMGFEIGNHTGHHKNMTKLSRDEMQQEVNFVEIKCQEYGIPKPISFAYPGNRDDSTSQSVLRQMGYRYARTGGSRYYDVNRDSELAIPSYTMGSTEKLEQRTWAALKSLKPGQILVFTIHGVPDIAHPDYTTAVSTFNEYLEYMRKRNFSVIALRDLEEYQKYCRK